jgi:hypothetical protein
MSDLYKLRAVCTFKLELFEEYIPKRIFYHYYLARLQFMVGR